MVFGEKRKQRKQLLSEILRDLEDLKNSGKCENLYALEENIKLYRALYSHRKYFLWLLKELPKIDCTKLLELSDFHIGNGKWEKILQAELLDIEKWKIPDILILLRKAILNQLNTLYDLNRRLVLVSLGSGSMEIERQIITTLRKNNNLQKLIIIGVDNSEESLNTAKNNLSSLDIPVIKINKIDRTILDEIENKNSKDQFIIVLLRGDALKIDQYFSEKSIDLLYHSKFKHHIPKFLQNKLDSLSVKIANKVIEYDDLNNWFLRIVPLVGFYAWNHPVLFSSGVFSSLRDPTKTQLLAMQDPDWTVDIHFNGYTRIYNK